MDATILFLIVSVVASIAATIFICVYLFYNQSLHGTQSRSKWFTRLHIWYLSLFGIGLSWIITILITCLYVGYTTMPAIGLFSGSTILFSLMTYYVYSLLFPSPFWSRHSLPNKQWNTIIDCRSPGEYEKGHYPNAIHWPIETLGPTNLKRRLNQLHTPVLVYDNTGQLSKQWIDLFYNLSHELGLKRMDVSYTDAHWTQIPRRKKSCD